MLLVLRLSVCRAYADVKWQTTKAAVEKKGGDRVSGVACAVECAGGLVSAPADRHRRTRRNQPQRPMPALSGSDSSFLRDTFTGIPSRTLAVTVQ